MEANIIINASVLAGVIKTLKPFMSTEETRFYLCGINMEVKADTGQLKAIATDGHKLCVLDVEAGIDLLEGDLSVIIPAKALATITQMLKGLVAECPIQLRFTDTQLFVDAMDEKGEFKLVDGTYPDWRKVVPIADPKFIIGLGKPQAKAALEAVKAHFGKDGLQWRMNDANSPILMQAEHKTVIIMPMRVALPGETMVDAEGGMEDSESDAELFKRAREVVARFRKCSTSFIQRELKVGYNRAARAVEWMEGEGIVGAANHVGKREVLLPPSEESEE